MTALGVIFTAIAVLTVAQCEYQASINGMQGIRIVGDTTEKREFVSTYQVQPGYDFLKLARDTDSPIEVLVAPEKVDQFKNALNEKDIKFEVFVEDVSKVLEENLALQKAARKSRAGSIFKSFPRHTEILNYLEEIAEQYSDIAKTFSIGKSYEGRDLLGLKISSGPGDKPVVVIDAGIHAREWMAPVTALYAIQQLVENSANHYLFEDVDIYVIPSLNPDGYEYTHQSIFTRLWRKTRSSHSSNPRCRGADANRNFDIAWMSIGASSDPCSETYAGPKAFSEVESVALRDFILSVKDKIKAYVSLHSFGQYILYPYGFTRTPPKTARQIKCVAKAADAALYENRGTEYTIGNLVDVLYPASGGSMDWVLAKTAAELSYTIELPGGRYGFAPPPRAILPVGRETFDAITVFIKYAKGEDVC